MNRATAAVGLLFILALAFAARALRFEHVFLDDGSVVFAIGDAFYHVHRALFSLHHFPDFLQVDPCINWPQGAPVPHPPDLAPPGAGPDHQQSFWRFGKRQGLGRGNDA